MKAIKFSDIVDENEKTIGENNMDIQHKYPIGTKILVDVDMTNSWGASIKGMFTLFVVNHKRDCDGTPLYSLSDIPVPMPGDENVTHLYRSWTSFLIHGYGEESLKPIDYEMVGRYDSFESFIKQFMDR